MSYQNFFRLCEECLHVERQHFQHLLWSVNKGKNFPSFEMLSACWVIGKIRMRFAASGKTTAVKRRAVEPVNKVKVLLVHIDAFTDTRFRHFLLIFCLAIRIPVFDFWPGLAILTHISPGFPRSLHPIKGQYLKTYHQVFRIFPNSTHINFRLEDIRRNQSRKRP
jgi:hypothetical protein